MSLGGPLASYGQVEVSPVYVSAPTPPLAVSVDPAALAADPSALAATVMVPEGDPSLEPSAEDLAGIDRGVPYVDPTIQLDRPFDGGLSVLDLGIGLISAPDQNFGGINSNGLPPDTVMDVGPNHVVQMTNGTFWQVWDKQGVPAPLPPPAAWPLTFGNLWPAGDPCNSNLGDPIVVYDHLADRWLLSQFARNAGQTQFWMCIAISQTPSPLPGNGYFLYTIPVPVFPDYPKFGVWPDAYYMSSYEGANLGVFAFDRAAMLNGAATSFQKFTLNSLSGTVRNTRILPADLDGPPPPNGTPNYFFRSVDDRQDNGNPDDRLEIYEFSVDWLNPGNSAFTLANTINGTSSPGLADFDTLACDRNNGAEATLPPNGPAPVRDCIPQPDSDNTLDALSNRPMMQLKFREFGSDFRMVVNQTIEVGGSIPATLGITPANEVAGVRWYELQKTGANWVIRQQGTYAAQPINAAAEGDLTHRWMGSAAMDRFGNIAMGYNVVNEADDDDVLGSVVPPAVPELYPGIRYTGRRLDDPLGFMQQGEGTIFTGTAPQDANGAQNPADVNGNDGIIIAERWGDYSAMTVDPADDCSFWFTTHVSFREPASRTQIASFRFDDCAADLSISKTAAPSPVTAGDQLVYTVTVLNFGPVDAPDVVVTDTLPVQVTYVSDTDDCTGGAVLTCDLGNLPAGSSTSFEILVDVDPGSIGPLDNTAVVASAIGDPDESNNTTSLSTLVLVSADLSVTKICKPDSGSAMAGGPPAECTIFVDNLGPSTAENVVLTDALVSDGIFSADVFTSAGSCNPLQLNDVGDGTFTCELGDMDAGERVEVTVQITSNDGVDVNDLATATSDTSDPDTSNNQDEDGVSFDAKADLALTKTEDPDPVVAGETLTYDLTVTNLGPSDAVNVVIEDILPVGVSIDSVSASAGACVAGVPGDASQPTTCTFDTLPLNQPETMKIVVTVDPDVPEGTILHNGARVSSDTADPDNSNDLAPTDSTVETEADLLVEKSDSPDPVLAGNVVSYSIVVTNQGPSHAVAVTLTDTLPPETTFVSAVSDNGGLCVEIQIGTVQCDLNGLAVNESVTVFVDALVDPSVPEGTTITDTATVSSATTDPIPGNNSASEDTDVDTEADLWIDKQGNFPTGNPSGTIIYFVEVHNAPGCQENDPETCGTGGPSDAQNVVVTDMITTEKAKDMSKVNIEFVSPNCLVTDPENLVIECAVGTLAYGASELFEIQISVNGSIGGLTNTANVTSDTNDPDVVNNTDFVDMTSQGGTGDPGGPGGGRGRNPR